MDVALPRRSSLVLAGALVAVMAWWPFVLGRRVPLLGWIDLAVHEAGHVLFLWAPHDVMLVMGSGLQVGLPLLVAAAFVVQERDLAGAAVGLAWSAQNLVDAAVYVADAPVRRLPLLGPEDSHDWWQLLGRHGWLGASDELALVLRLAATAMMALAVVVLVAAARGWTLPRHRPATSAPSGPDRAVRQRTLDTEVDVDREPVDVTVMW